MQVVSNSVASGNISQPTHVHNRWRCVHLSLPYAKELQCGPLPSRGPGNLRCGERRGGGGEEEGEGKRMSLGIAMGGGVEGGGGGVEGG